MLAIKYADLVECQIPGISRLSKPACLYRQAKTFAHPRAHYEDEQVIDCRVTRAQCAGCEHELSEKRRKMLQAAIRRGFRFEGKDSVASRPWVKFTETEQYQQAKAAAAEAVARGRC